MIKFRAWYMPFGKYGAMQEIVYSIASHILALAETEPEKYIPEQFTGLHDKNGREIYEGDVVRYTAWHDGKPAGAIQGEVVYDGDLGMASFNILLDRDGEIDRAVLPAIGVEVIGNVHANPELLKG